MNLKEVMAGGAIPLLVALSLTSCGSNPTSDEVSSKSAVVAATRSAPSSSSTSPSYPATYPSVPGTLRSTTSGEPFITVTDCEVSSQTQAILASTHRLAIASGVF